MLVYDDSSVEPVSHGHKLVSRSNSLRSQVERWRFKVLGRLVTLSSCVYDLVSCNQHIGVHFLAVHPSLHLSLSPSLDSWRFFILFLIFTEIFLKNLFNVLRFIFKNFNLGFNLLLGSFRNVFASSFVWGNGTLRNDAFSFITFKWMWTLNSQRGSQSFYHSIKGPVILHGLLYTLSSYA